MSKRKVGVIGVGSMGKNHVRAYAALNQMCELIGVYDINDERKNEIANSYGVKAFDSNQELMKEVDAVNIATPTTTHYEIADRALEEGLHILVEKPITDSLEEAKNLLRKANEKDLRVQVGHIERFNPAIQALPGVLQDKEVLALDVHRLGPYDPRIDDTDVIQDLMIHDMDIVSSLVPGEIKDLSAFGRNVASNSHIDYAVANIRIDGGVIATLTASRATNKKVRQMAITTKNTYIELDYLQRKIKVTRRGGIRSDKSGYQRENELEETYGSEEEPLKSQLAHFLRSIENGTRPLINGSDGMEALKLTKKIQNLVYNKSENCERLNETKDSYSLSG
ncbi:Gfo/Idh/MocA family protein [Halarsenatibacter silvermanii]|uniref:Oxidoreductase family, NAD-binding Rossmann fold n=1 Tax=Halarsenatibacter silvermanii TaxID=321763 RepID=A0A1G9LXQ2_9FIRM|nr:Gfo/Idh/MocA family oxidoreductase [Halarsenatibacter silvermanii]SDL66477.1 Oxidoreductase family, NAD-binding Rossmann fold [Halarsenatibacter silvermanii]